MCALHPAGRQAAPGPAAPSSAAAAADEAAGEADAAAAKPEAEEDDAVGPSGSRKRKEPEGGLDDGPQVGDGGLPRDLATESVGSLSAAWPWGEGPVQAHLPVGACRGAACFAWWAGEVVQHLAEPVV